ncbi:hypothetical protein CRE_27331 [Caenorhabditis remanei]|uniref:C2 domain-containing protein n=1 Tax=Caenorhabditis remanei TaxID=31234 RepID=E3LPR9_CAERE|nr:hypothetical protein CRE_27331 [Caenorhabditis remanei]
MHSNGISRGHNGDSRRSSMVDATGRFCSQPTTGSPEILVGLCYDDKHEVVSVCIEKASSLGSDNAHPPDSFIRIIGLDEFSTELSRHKTDTVKHSTQPVYSHHCTMRFSKDKVESSTVRVEVWTVTGILRRKVQIGSISIGFASSTPDANEHWQQMMQISSMTTNQDRCVDIWKTVRGPKFLITLPQQIPRRLLKN